MPIQLIVDKHGWAGYQARFGPWKSTRSAYFSIAKYGIDEARRLAEEAERRYVAEGPPCSKTGPRGCLSSNNASTINGIRLCWETYSSGRSYLSVIATWSRDKRAHATKFSVNKHGAVEAVRLAMREREKGAGMIFDITPRQAWLRLKQAYDITLNG